MQQELLLVKLGMMVIFFIHTQQLQVVSQNKNHRLVNGNLLLLP
jgi:hypothetical protein